MANWIKAIYFVVILAWVIYVLSDDAVKYKSFPRRFGLSVAPDCHHRIGRLCFMACSCSYEYQIAQRRFRGR